MADGTKPQTTFERLLAIDVSEHVEKKGKFSYLSWAWAVAELRRHCPLAAWEVKRWPLVGSEALLVPYCETPTGVFVEVAVTVDGITLSQVHPVLSDNNRTIEKPTAFDVNRSIQRALVKAIALHGLGLNLYAGEDLPLGSSDEEERLADLGKQISAELDRLSLGGQLRAQAVYSVLKKRPETVDEYTRVLAALRDRVEA